MKIREVIQFLEGIAPTSYQENYDNSGLIVGDASAELTGVLCSLDATEPIIEEAIEKGCNLVVAHHPIVFGGLKKITGRNYVERTVIKAIKNDVAIYAIHTNLDHVQSGVNAKIAEKIGLQNCRILAPKKQLLSKLTVFVPHSHKEELLTALSQAGAGNIGNYSECSFQVSGLGTFKPSEKANPYMGKADELETVDEARIEVILPTHTENRVLSAMRKAHPYEEVAYYLHRLENENQEVGAGMVGELLAEMSEANFLKHLKKVMSLPLIKHTALRNKPIKRVAVCGGAGSFLLRKARGANADIFITGDYKYHEFFDAEGRIIIADIGHYESEIFTKNLLADWLTEAFSGLKLEICETNTNPVNYFVG